MSVETRQSTILPSPRRRVVPLLVAGSILVALLTAGAALYVSRSYPSAASSDLPVLSDVPPFAAVRQDGAAVTERQLAGSVWVADFVFTRCPTICPELTAKMASLQALSERRLPELKLVTFTVDPTFDTPARLADYGRKYQADFSRWSFLNVPIPTLEGTVLPGFLQDTGRRDAADLVAALHSHASPFVLVDRNLKVRGFYGSAEGTTMERVLRDAESLARLAPN